MGEQSRCQDGLTASEGFSERRYLLLGSSTKSPNPPLAKGAEGDFGALGTDGGSLGPTLREGSRDRMGRSKM